MSKPNQQNPVRKAPAKPARNADNKPNPTDKSTADKPIPGKSTVEKPVPGKSTVDKPVPGKSTIDKPTSGKSVVDKPAPDKPVVKKPVPDKHSLVKPVPTKFVGKPVPNKNVPDKPVPGKPVPGKPVPGKPVPGKTVPGKPVPAKPVPGKPVGDKPPDKSVPAKPIVDKPVPAKPIVDKPVPAKPIVDKPVPAKPIVEKPIPGKPVIDKPVPIKPTVDKPVPGKSTIDKPVPDISTGDKPTPSKPTADKPIEPVIITDDMIDGVLVYKKDNGDVRRTRFINNMLKKGFIVNYVDYEAYKDLKFIKIHLPKQNIIDFAKEFDIPLKMSHRFNIVRFSNKPLKKLASINYNRTMQTPKGLTTYEQQYIVYHMLKMIPYGKGKDEFGISNLIQLKVFTDIYSIHEGDYKWPKDPNMKPTDRQLLFHYWSHYKFIFDNRPVALIEKYFGSDVGMYFQLMHFYIKMLGVASLLGVVYVLVLAIATRDVNKHTYVINGCSLDNITICPPCTECKPKVVSDYCPYFYVSYVLDHPLSCVFGCSIAVWGFLFVRLWKRKESVLCLKWQLTETHINPINIRQEFKAKAKQRINFFNEPELYIPSRIKVFRRILSTAIICTTCGIIVLITMYVICSEVFWDSMVESRAINIMTVSAINQVSILIVPKFYDLIVYWVTKLDLLETQAEFDHAYIVRLFMFSSINAYSGVIFMTFFNGVFYTNPKDPRFMTPTRKIYLESCRPYGCAPEIFLFLCSTMLTRIIIVIIQSLWIYILNLVKMLLTPKWKKRIKDIVVTNYELSQPENFIWAKRYNETAIQYGLIVMFSISFPLAPLILLVTNILDMKREGILMITNERRKIGKKRKGIGTWLIIMIYLSNLAIMTNGYYITFATGIVGKLMYKMTNDLSITGYIQSCLSEYVVEDAIWKTLKGIPVCYYVGNRYPEGHPHEYQLTRTYTFLTGIKLTFLIVFEHVVMALTVMFSCVIPELPRTVRDIAHKTKDDSPNTKIYSTIRI